jgi:hypothetical protein
MNDKSFAYSPGAISRLDVAGSIPVSRSGFSGLTVTFPNGWFCLPSRGDFGSLRRESCAIFLPVPDGMERPESNSAICPAQGMLPAWRGENRSGGKPMGNMYKVMIRCPVSSHEVDTGIRTTGRESLSSDISEGGVLCPDCQRFHKLSDEGFFSVAEETLPKQAWRPNP